MTALALAGCSSCSGDAPAAAAAKDEKEDAIAVRTGAITRDTLSELYTTTTTLRADKQATVTARTEGIVERLFVEEGDRVDEGQALAQLESDEQRIAAEKASATAETLRREFERAESLHSQGLLSDEEYETARRQSVEAQHTAELAALEHQRTTIRAPFAGRVLRRHLDVGATVSRGTAVYDLADLDPLYADIAVPERHIRRLAVGQTVRLSADSSGRLGDARIERIAPLVDTETGTVKVTLAVRGGADLRPGTFVRADVVIDTHADTLVTPRSALVPEGRRWHLFRLGPDGAHVERIEVRRGFEEGERVEVWPADEQQSLATTDTVVIVGASALSDGSLVDARNGEDQANDGTDRDAS